LYRQEFQKEIDNTHNWLGETCKKIQGAYYDNRNRHYLTSICFPEIPYELGKNKEILWEIMDNTGGAFIPGTLNNYPKETGFSFRINMARDSVQFKATIMRLLLFLSNMSF
jgi:hypothetical protein